MPMPIGVLVLLVYGFLLLAGMALTLPLVVELAVEAPISPLGLLWMLLLAYVIFTLTLILQRKQAGWMFSIGLVSLSLPLVVALFVWGGLPGAAVGAVVAALLLYSVTRPPVRSWFSEP